MTSYTFPREVICDTLAGMASRRCHFAKVVMSQVRAAEDVHTIYCWSTR